MALLWLYRCDVVDLISYPRNIASKADIHLGILLLVRKHAVLGDRYIGVVRWRWQFCRNNVILSVQVFVNAVGVKLLKVLSTEFTVF